MNHRITTLSTQIKVMMTELGITQKDLADEMGMSQPDLCKALAAEKVLERALFFLKRKHEVVFGKNGASA